MPTLLSLQGPVTRKFSARTLVPCSAYGGLRTLVRAQGFLGVTRNLEIESVLVPLSGRLQSPRPPSGRLRQEVCVEGNNFIAFVLVV